MPVVCKVGLWLLLGNPRISLLELSVCAPLPKLMERRWIVALQLVRGYGTACAPVRRNGADEVQKSPRVFKGRIFSRQNASSRVVEGTTQGDTVFIC